MYAVKQFRDCVGGWVEYLTTNRFQTSVYKDAEMAHNNACKVVLSLQHVPLELERVRPHQKAVLELLNKVEQELAAENGGTLPDAVLSYWRETCLYGCYDEQQKQSMRRVCKRWCGTDRVREEFRVLQDINCVLRYYRLQNLTVPNMLAEQCLDELANWARNWLAKKRENGKLD